MLKTIIGFCIRERLIVILLTTVIVVAGWICIDQVPVDAIPNVGENQVIVFTSWPGRSPKDVEDQVTYPLSVSLLGVPGAESVRGKSMFGFSFVQVTFEDSLDFYWARSRVAEQLLTVGSKLPDGVTPSIGPDATALGQVLYYVLDAPPGKNLADLRTLQDFKIRYELQAVHGVSEVASVGGYVRQYQVEIDPNRLRFHGIPLDEVVDQIKDSNIDVGAKTIEQSGMEFIIRGKGFLGGDNDPRLAIRDIEETVVVNREGIPVRVKDLGYVQLGPDFRRGAIDLNGAEAVGGVVVMRFGENPRKVIDNVKKKIEELERSPAVLDGVKIKLIYDRTQLIDETIATLSDALLLEIIITVVVILLFLLHIRASLVVAVTLPVAVLMAFIAMKLLGVDANIMSLAGIAIAIGTMVDMGIVVSENIYQHLTEHEARPPLRRGDTGGVDDGGPGKEERTTPLGPPFARGEEGSTTPLARGEEESTTPFARGDEGSTPPLARGEESTTPFARWDEGSENRRVEIIKKAAAEVAPAVITAVSTTVISFLPVFFLTGRDYKLFAPLAWTKTYALLASLVVAVLLVPMLCRIFLRSSRWPRWESILAGIALGGILSATCLFVWGDHLAYLTGLALPLGVILSLVVGFAVGYGITREKLRPVDANPVARFIVKTYEPTLRWFLGHKWTFSLLPLAVIFLGIGAWIGLPAILKPFERFTRLLGTEMNEVPGYVQGKHVLPGLKSDDWIALDEGSWFYMPTLYPGVSLTQAMEVIQTQDTLIKQIPEVSDVLGKIGRVDSALDPAPVAMVETYVMLKPRSEWREGMTEKNIWKEINRVAKLPGVTQASELQPIEGRVVMLQSGIKASMAVRIYGDDLNKLAEASGAIAEHLRTKVPLVNSGSVNPDIVLGKPYVEFTVDRENAARFGMSVRMVNTIIETALGGTNVDTTVEERERYPIRIRYQREWRERLDELEEMPVVTHKGEVVPLKALASMKTTWGPGEMTSENARLVAHVTFSPVEGAGKLETVAAVEAFLKDLDDRLKEEGKQLLPDGYSWALVGSFENQIEAYERLMFLVPLVIFINLFIIYLQFRNLPTTLMVFAGIPVAFGGGMIMLGLAEIKMNTAVWVGFIALFGIAVDDGVVMATYLVQVFRRQACRSIDDVRNAVVEAGRRRIRPCLMTTVTTLAALLPVLLATGRGADVARAMALPVFGGMVVELITLFVVPVLFSSYQEWRWRAGMSLESEPESVDNRVTTLIEPVPG